jgi:hypothetical protein
VRLFSFTGLSSTSEATEHATKMLDAVGNQFAQIAYIKVQAVCHNEDNIARYTSQCFLDYNLVLRSQTWSQVPLKLSRTESSETTGSGGKILGLAGSHAVSAVSTFLSLLRAS